MITQDQLTQVTELAGLFFTLEEISLLTHINAEELKREVMFGSSDLNAAYWTGKLEAIKAIRISTKAFAEKGSPQAEEQMLEHLRRMNESEN